MERHRLVKVSVTAVTFTKPFTCITTYWQENGCNLECLNDTETLWKSLQNSQHLNNSAWSEAMDPAKLNNCYIYGLVLRNNSLCSGVLTREVKHKGVSEEEWDDTVVFIMKCISEGSYFFFHTKERQVFIDWIRYCWEIQTRQRSKLV